MRSLFRHRDFLLYGQSLSTVRDRLVIVALALYVTDIGTPSDVGIVLACHAVPLVGFLLIGGVWADRLPRHLVVVTTDLIRFGLHGLLAALIFTGAIEIWHIALIEAAFGTAEAFYRPAFTGLVPQLFDIWWHTALAERVQPHMLSRVTAYDWMGSLALLTIGYVLAGPLGEEFGAVEVLSVGSAIALAALAAALTSREVWNLRATAAVASR
jgi:hypothetical protein